MKKLIPAGIIILIFVLIITGCSGPGRGMSHYLYIACTNNGSMYGIATFKIGSDGILTPVTSETLPMLLDEITAMTADHQGNNVYVAHNSVSYNISIHTIKIATGELFLRSKPSVPNVPQSLAIDPSDRFLGCTFTSSSEIKFFNVNDFTNPILQKTVNNPCGAAFNPLNHSFYITKYNDNTLLTLKYNPNDGQVFDNWESSPLTSGLNHPVHVVVHPNGQYIYVVNDESTGNSISGFKLTGEPDRIQPLPKVQTALMNLRLTIDPLGRYLYATNLNGSIITIYGISPQTGQLTRVNEFVPNTSSIIKSIVATPDGRYVYVSDYYRKVISMFKVTNDATVLTPTGTEISTASLGFGYPGVMAIGRRLQ